MDTERIAQAIEEDAGQSLDGLRDSLKEMEQGEVGRKYTLDQMLIKNVRTGAEMSQGAFASLINTPVATLRDWEQGRFSPPGSVICLMKLIEKRPETINDLGAFKQTA
jgi:putative transcriptional regulator